MNWKIEDLERENGRLKAHVDTVEVETQTILTESYFKKDRQASRGAS